MLHSRRAPRRRLPAFVVLLGLGIVAPAAASTYTLRPGDSLSAVAARFGVSVPALAATNRIPDPNHVMAGQRLEIPSTDSPASKTVARSDYKVGRDPGPSSGTANGTLPRALLVSPTRLALRPFFRTWAAAYAVPADLIEGLAWQESGWQSGVESSTGALGIGQLEPATATFVSSDLLHVALDAHRPEDNIRMTARYLAYLLDATHGDVPLAVASYYQGLSSVRRAGLFADTQAYVRSVLALRLQFSPG